MMHGFPLETTPEHEYVQKLLSYRRIYAPCGFVADHDVKTVINILQARTEPARSTA
jgi:hypothetical protein